MNEFINTGLVTGGASGLGKALISKLSSIGMHATVLDRHDGPLYASFRYVICDVTSESEVSKDLCESGEKFSNVDVNSWLYSCGPAGFKNVVIGAAKQAGLMDAKMRKEIFGGSMEPVSRETVRMDPTFVIKIRSTGAMLEVPIRQTAVQVLAASGIGVLVSCEQRHCGSCLMPVLKGIPYHRAYFMLPEKLERNDVFTPCCSRSLTPCLPLSL